MTDKLLFGGIITTNQAIVMLICVAGFIFAIKVAKKAIKVILSLFMAAVMAVNIGCFSPKQTDISNLLTNRTQITQITKTCSDKIKIDGSDGFTVYVNVGNKWLDVRNIIKYTKVGSRYRLFTNDGTYTTDASEIGDIISMMNSR